MNKLFANLNKKISAADEKCVLLLVQPVDGQTDKHFVSGILDFGDIHHNFYIFDIAIAICYMVRKTDVTNFVYLFNMRWIYYRCLNVNQWTSWMLLVMSLLGIVLYDQCQI